MAIKEIKEKIVDILMDISWKIYSDRVIDNLQNDGWIHEDDINSYIAERGPF